MLNFLLIGGDWLTPLSFIFGGCCTNVIALEDLVRQVPKCGNLITLSQFLFITLISLPSQLEFDSFPRLRARQVPLYRWAVMVGLYFGVSTLNNLALGYQVSIPLHIVFRSSGLIANMLCGWLVASKRYPRQQIVAVVMVSVGVVMATLSSVSTERQNSEETRLVHGVPETLVGIVFLSMGVLLAALLGLYQETTYRLYGKHWQEGLFYNHLLALPMFLVFYQDIFRQSRALTQQSYGIEIWQWELPSLWVSLALNVLSQLMCVTGVHRMTAMSSSLSLNVVLNLRKLVSLVISVVWFRNQVRWEMVVGCGLVFVGTFAYSRSPKRIKKE